MSPVSLMSAREIMGNHLIALGDSELLESSCLIDKPGLLEAPWSEETLARCSTSHILVEIPTLSIMDMKRSKKGGGYFSAEKWYEPEVFANRKVAHRWHLVRKTPVPDSGSKWWLEQQAMLDKSERTPEASVLVYAAIEYFLKTGERLFEKSYVRTFDVAADRKRVSFCFFNQEGIHLDSWSEIDYGHIQVSSEMRPEC